jgi:TonB family protein
MMATSIFHRIFFLLSVLLLTISTQIFAQINLIPLTNADIMPHFAGCNGIKNSLEKRNCSNQRLANFIAEQLIYPDTARAQGIEGVVYVSFVVNEVGKVTNTTILRDIGGNCGQEALRILEKMPLWEAGSMKGNPVKIKLNLPIHFKLSEEQIYTPYYSITWGHTSSSIVTRPQLKALLNHPIIIRDQLGKQVNVQELNLVYEKGRQMKSSGSSGSITEDMQNLVNKAKKGSIITIIATISRNNEVMYVEKRLEVVNGK